MGVFGRGKATKQIAVGDSVFWRGMRMEVVELIECKSLQLVEYANEYYTCTTKVTDLTFREDIKIWGVNGCEGRMPKLIRGEIVDPDLPKCECGTVTWRRRSSNDESPLCDDCRLILKNSQESNMEGNI